MQIQTHSRDEAVHVAATASRRLRLRVRLVAIDAVAALAGWASALAWVRGGVDSRLTLFIGLVVFASFTTLVAIALQRLYLARVCSVRAVEVERLGRAALFAGLAMLVIREVFGLPVSLRLLGLGAVLSFILLMIGRSLYRSWLKVLRRRGEQIWDIILVGGNVEAMALASIVADHPELGMRISGYVGEYSDTDFGCPWLGGYDDTLRVARSRGVDGVLMVASAVPHEQLNTLVRGLHDAGLHVHLSSGLSGISHRRVRFVPLVHEPLLYLERADLSRWEASLKRGLDLVVAASVLVVTAPVLLVAAIAVKLDSRGPLLFRQERVGLAGDLFTLYKLRTMTADAEDRLSEVWDRNQRGGGPLFKLSSDPRVTRVGRVLRALSIDELPQLFNVLQGTMSVVGPRPALPHEVSMFDEELRGRTRVHPGITGLWQMEARDNPAFGPYRRLDLFYVENWSVGLDISIIIGTCASLMGRTCRVLGGIVVPSRRDRMISLID